MTRTIAAIAVLAVLITVAAVTFRASPPVLAVWGTLGAAGIIRAHLRRKQKEGK